MTDETILAENAETLKKLPFNRSWQSNFVGHKRKIVNQQTGALEEKDLGDFVSLVAPQLVKSLSTDKEFLSFRVENRGLSDFNYKLVPDKTEDTNRRMAIKFIVEKFAPFNMEYLIDDGYNFYIMRPEIEKLREIKIRQVGELYVILTNGKTIAHKEGIVEQWSQ